MRVVCRIKESLGKGVGLLMMRREKLASHIEEDGDPKAFWRSFLILTSKMMHMRWKGKDIQVTWMMIEMDI